MKGKRKPKKVPPFSKEDIVTKEVMDLLGEDALRQAEEDDTGWNAPYQKQDIVEVTIDRLSSHGTLPLLVLPSPCGLNRLTFRRRCVSTRAHGTSLGDRRAFRTSGRGCQSANLPEWVYDVPCRYGGDSEAQPQISGRLAHQMQVLWRVLRLPISGPPSFYLVRITLISIY